MSPKEIGSAWSPPSPCPKALEVKAGIVKIPIIAISNTNLLDNNSHEGIPYLKIAQNYHVDKILKMILSEIFIYGGKREII